MLKTAGVLEKVSATFLPINLYKASHHICRRVKFRYTNHAEKKNTTIAMTENIFSDMTQLTF